MGYISNTLSAIDVRVPETAESSMVLFFSLNTFTMSPTSTSSILFLLPFARFIYVPGMRQLCTIISSAKKVPYFIFTNV